MPSFNWTQPHRPWVTPKKSTTSLGRSPHAFDKRYKSQRWRALRLDVLQSSPLCCSCQDSGSVKAARVVDHIIPVRQGGSFWDKSNLQPLCDSCHNSKSGKESHGITENVGGRGSKNVKSKHHRNVGDREIFFVSKSEGEV